MLAGYKHTGCDASPRRKINKTNSDAEEIFSSNPSVFVNNNTTVDCRHTRKIINFFIINSRTFWKYKDSIFDILCPDLPEIHDNDRISFLRKRLKYIEVIWVNWPDRAKLKINIEVRRCKCLLSLAENTMPMIFYTDCIYKQEFRMVAPAENICLLIRKVLLSIMFNFLSTLKKLGNEVTFNFWIKLLYSLLDSLFKKLGF